MAVLPLCWWQCLGIGWHWYACSAQAKPANDPLETILYATSVGVPPLDTVRCRVSLLWFHFQDSGEVPSVVYDTVRSLRQAVAVLRSVRMGRQGGNA